MSERIVFPDAEEAVRLGLEQNITNVAWFTRVPTDRPTAFGRVQRTGGVKHTLVTDAAQITVESWAATETDAVSTLQDARGYINSLYGMTLSGSVVTHVEEASGLVNQPDPDTASNRYTMSFLLHFRGTTNP